MTNDSNISKVKLYGQPNSPLAYQIRDFLKRSVVEFDWVELNIIRAIKLNNHAKAV